MCKYLIQMRGNSGKWRTTGSHVSFKGLDSAVTAACRSDEDGIFPGDVRIVDDTGAVIVTAKSWFDQFRAAGMKDFRYVP